MFVLLEMRKNNVEMKRKKQLVLVLTSQSGHPNILRSIVLYSTTNKFFKWIIHTCKGRKIYGIFWPKKNSV